MTKLFSEFDKVKLLVGSIEAIFGVIGASLILTEHHPYLALGALAIARTSTQWASWVSEKEEEIKKPAEKPTLK